MRPLILFDLDGTLLKNSDLEFIPAYLLALGEYLNARHPSESTQAAVLGGTNRMVANKDPRKTLENCFDEYFYPKIGFPKEVLIAEIEAFYKEKFPKLKNYTSVTPQAENLISQLSKQNFNIVIATNPLFPLTAIAKRIDWANLGQSPDDFFLVSSFEHFHAAKPNPEYYAEILARSGWPENIIGMVGNDWAMDILPAEMIGLPTFFLCDTPIDQNPERHPLSGQGNWQDLEVWVKRLGSQLPISIEPKATPQAYSAILFSTAAAIDDLMKKDALNGLWNTRPEPNEWSLVEIFAHIADVDEEVNIPRITAIQSEKMPFFPAAMTDEWALERNYLGRDPITEMTRFINNRSMLLERIRTLSEDDFSKLVNHAIFGPTTVLEIIKFITQHDRIHLQQIQQTIHQICAR